MYNIDKKIFSNNYVLVPKNIDKDIYEKLGFKIYEKKHNKLFYMALLPTNWKLVKVSELYTNLIDDLGRIRGEIFYNHKDVAKLTLRRRYDIRKTSTMFYFMIYFGTEEEMLYKTEPIYFSKHIGIREMQEKEAREECAEYALDYYPDYEDPLAYWDKEQKIKRLI